ncbi:MAG: hypothetical protein VXW66_04775, partial [Pseudomonadota bacterium]|nr:hypothetical protein [Pseudomonadota bacterium]
CLGRVTFFLNGQTCPNQNGRVWVGHWHSPCVKFLAIIRCALFRREFDISNTYFKGFSTKWHKAAKTGCFRLSLQQFAYNLGKRQSLPSEPDKKFS